MYSTSDLKELAEKIIEILDNKLLDQNSLKPYGIEEKRLREGKSNTSKDFKSIYFLLRYHKKNRNYRELEKIKSIIRCNSKIIIPIRIISTKI